MRYGTPSFPGIENAINIIYERGFNNYISPVKYEKMIDENYTFIEWDFGPNKENTKKKIKEILLRGNFITCGYMASSIKWHHIYYIIYKP